MVRLPYRLTLGATFVVLLAACTSAAAPAVSPTPVIRSVPSPSASPTAQPAAPALLPLVGLNRVSPDPVAGLRLRMRPVDPVTLADIPGIAPLDFAHHYVQAVSPDGRTMAAIIWPSGASNSGGVLHLIDRTTWVDTATAVTVRDYVAGLVFSPDGQSLYWAGSTRHDAAHGIGQDYALSRYTLTSGDLHEVTRFSPSFTPGFLATSGRFLRSGTQLALYGILTDANNLAEDMPHVLIVDLTNERIAADIRLDGVKAGQFQESVGGSTDRYALFSPGLAWDRARDRLYIAHADVDTLTVVDLAGGRVLSQTKMQSHRSLVGRIADWLMPGVAAKGGPTTDRQALLSHDGTRLYTISQRTEIVTSPNGQPRERTVPLGLQVIDTGTLQEVRRLDLPASAMMLAPDGQHLLLHTFRDDGSDSAAPAHAAPHMLITLDANTLTERGRIDFDAAFSLAGFSPDGRDVYLSQPIDPWAKQVAVKVFDVQTQRFTAERTLDGYFADLLVPRNDSTP